MKAVGEVMSIGKNYKEAFQKAIRSLESKRYGLGFADNFNQLSLEELMRRLSEPSSERQFLMYEALRKGADVGPALRKDEDQALVHSADEGTRGSGRRDPHLQRQRTSGCPPGKAKEDGFSDKYLSQILGVTEDEHQGKKDQLGKTEAWCAVPVSGADASYYYSTYNAPDEVTVSARPKVMILGGGPNRIGQGIEFDYTCVHAAFTLRDEGYESIMVNCNPETVSTDYDTSDKLYFEPLTVEDVLSIYDKEKPIGVIVQFGGQTPLNIAKELELAGVKILGTSTESIDLAEDRKRFKDVMPGSASRSRKAARRSL